MDVNPRGMRKPQNGQGGGVGQPGGLRQNQNPTPCEEGKCGLGKGKGKFREK